MVRYSVPEKVSPEVRSPRDIVNHVGSPLSSYVNHAANRISPWCAMSTPQPDSLPAGEFHHMPW